MAQVYEVGGQEKVLQEERAPTAAELAREAEIDSALAGGEYFVLPHVRSAPKAAAAEQDAVQSPEEQLERAAEYEAASRADEGFIVVLATKRPKN